jgi:hypothetical protein
MNAQNAENNALNATAQTAATTATAQASIATTQATAAQAAAAYKGEWSTLTGPLNIPATVLHLGRVWLLNANIANVASAEPGVSTAWTAIVTPQRPSIRPSLSVDWTLKPTAAALTSAGWTISRASEITSFGAAPVKVAENLFTNSRAPNSWTTSTVNRADVTDESGIAGSSVVATAVAGYHAVYISLPAGTYLPSSNYRVRFLVKAGAYTKAFIADGANGRAAAAFDLATGATIATTAGAGYISHSITPHELGNGLYWCELVLTSGAVDTFAPGIIGYPNSGATLGQYGAQYTGDGVSGIELYAAQLQQGFDGPWLESTTQPVTLYEAPLVTTASNELAYQHNQAGECTGLVSYPAATNLCLYSQNLAHATWTKVGVSVAQTKRLWAGSAPFFRLARNTSTATEYDSQSITVSSTTEGQQYSFTVALLADVWSGCSELWLGLRNDTSFSWPTGSMAILSGPGVLASPSASVGQITGLSESVPTVVRVTGTFPAGVTSIGPYIYPQTNGLGTIGAAILATRVQVEAGPRATPYIPTTSATVTRAAQTVSFGGSAFAAINNPAQGTLLSRASVEDAVFDQTLHSLVTVGSATSSYSYIGNYGTDSAPYFVSVYNSTTQINAPLFSVSYSTTPVTAAYSYARNASQGSANGALTAIDTSCLVPVVTSAAIGTWAGLIQRTELYPRAMTASELQAVTTPGVL